MVTTTPAEGAEAPETIQIQTLHTGMKAETEEVAEAAEETAEIATTEAEVQTETDQEKMTSKKLSWSTKRER